MKKVLTLFFCFLASHISLAQEVVSGGSTNSDNSTQVSTQRRDNYIMLRNEVVLYGHTLADGSANRGESIWADRQGRIQKGSFCCSSQLAQCLMFSTTSNMSHGEASISGKISISRNSRGQLIGRTAQGNEILIQAFDWDFKRNKASNFRTPTAPTGDIAQMQCVGEIKHDGLLFDGDHGTGPRGGSL